METPQVQDARTRRTVNDLVMAEMFLLQATLESATVIGDGINELGRQFNQAEGADWNAISDTLQRIADDALEPYTCRYRYFRGMINDDR